MQTHHEIAFQTLYAETILEQIMLTAIQSSLSIQQPKQQSIQQMLVSYNYSHTNNILQTGAYGYWAKTKKKILFVYTDTQENIIIQNPTHTNSIGKKYKSLINTSHYTITKSTTIDKNIQKHLHIIALLTQIQYMSILIIPQTYTQYDTLYQYIQQWNKNDTIIVYLANIYDGEYIKQNNSSVIAHLRERAIGANQTHTLQYKNQQKQTPQNKKHYLHQGIS